MNSAISQTGAPAGPLTSAAVADVESSTSQDGSDDVAGGSPERGVMSPPLAEEDAKKKSGGREDGSVSKDQGKKKKSRGSAKLKQNKLDIRREQFLAQAKSFKGATSTGLHQKLDTPVTPQSSGNAPSVEDQSSGPMSCDSTDCGSSHLSSTGTEEDYQADEGEAGMAKAELTKPEGKGSRKKGNGAAGTPTLVPCNSAGSSQQLKVKAGRKAGKGSPPKHGRNGSTQHQVDSQHSNSGDTGESGDLEDDWEAAAEEFSKQVAKLTNGKAPGTKGSVSEGNLQEAGKQESAAPLPAEQPSSEEPRTKPPLPGSEYSFRPNQQDPGMHPKLCVSNGLRPEYSFSGSAFGRSRSATDRALAWRPDDVSRPPTLPPAWTQRPSGRGLLGVPGDVTSWRIPQLAQSHWPAPSTATTAQPNVGPPCCPICAEELDMTDSSFVPCSCGFRLCLFCHHRIAADDGRCPGCRRAYSPDVASRLSRPSSLWTKF